MTKVTLYENIFLEHEVQVLFDGHANSADPGQDLVCAALSILAESFAHSAKELYERGKADSFHMEPSSFSGSSGKMLIDVKVKDVEFAFALAGMYDMLLAGVCLLAGSYPEFVEVDISKVSMYDGWNEHRSM